MARLKYLLFALVLIPINAAEARGINQADAEKLKTSFQGLLDYQKTVNEAFGSVRIIYEGELTVVPEDTFYTITFPHISMKGPAIEGLPDDDVAFDIGVIKINAMPDIKPGYWKTILTFPSKMTVNGGTPEDNFSISFADQQSIALYSEALGYFTKMDMNLSGITFQAAGEDVGVNVGSAQMYMKMEDQGEGLYTGPGHLLLSNLLIAPPNEDETISVGEFKADFSMTDFKMPSLKEYQDKILKHAKTFESLSSLEQSEDVPPVNGTDIMNMIMDLYDFDMGGFTFEYSAKNVNVTSDPENEFREFDTLQIGSAAFGLGFDGIQTESGSMTINGGYDTVNMTPVDPEYKDVIPQDLDVNIKALNVPYGALVKVATNTAEAIAADPAAAQMAGLGVLMRLPAILAQADTQVVVENNGASNGTYDFGIDGKVMTDLSALTGFTAEFNAIFEGLDALLAIAKQNALNADSPNAYEFEEMATKLTKLKEVGKAQAGPNGKPAYGFTIEATPQGEFLVNGKDANTVFSQ